MSRDKRSPNSPRRAPKALRACAFGLVFAAGGAFGATAQFAPSSDEPVDITSDRLESKDNVVTWIGNVRAVQGEAILTTDRLILIRNDEGAVDTVKAIGKVRYDTGAETITGEEAIYDEIARTLTMLRNVVVTQGKQVMTGGELVYWIDTGQLSFTSPGGHRVRGIFYTDSLESQS